MPNQSHENLKTGEVCRPGLVSVIIAAFNAEEFISETIRSVLSQSYPHIEIIVVDDGSTDGTRDVVKSFGDRVRLLPRAPSGGPSAPRNFGAATASGEYLCFFDADDIMLSDRVEEQVRFLTRNPEAVAVSMDYRDFSSGGEFKVSHFDTCTTVRRLLSEASGKDAIYDVETIRGTLLVENFGCTCAMMFRRNAFHSSRGFDEGLFVGEDIELLYRVAASGMVGIIDKIGFRRRLHASNVSGRKEFTLREKIRSRERMLASETAGDRRQVLRTTLARYQLALADELSMRVPSAAMRCLRSSHGYGGAVLSPVSMRIFCKIVVALLTGGRAARRQVPEDPRCGA